MKQSEWMWGEDKPAAPQVAALRRALGAYSSEDLARRCELLVSEARRERERADRHERYAEELARQWCRTIVRQFAERRAS